MARIKSTTPSSQKRPTSAKPSVKKRPSVARAAPAAKPKAGKLKASTRSMTIAAVPPVARLTVIDVGHGNSAVLVAGGQNIVFDAGPGSSLLEFLREANIVEVHEVFVSHADQDHIEGILALLGENIRIHSVRVNTDSLKESELWNDLLYEIEQKRLAGETRLRIGLTSDLAPFTFGQVVVTVLGPSPYLAARGPGSTDNDGRAINSNSSSAVLRVGATGERGVLFTGDLDGVGLADLERCNVSLDADVLVYPHHGGRAATNDGAFARRLADLAKANHVLFSIERGGRNPGNPRPDVVAAIRQALPNARIACTQLSIHCAAATPASDPLHLLPIYSRGRPTKACCAGSMVLDLPIRTVTPMRPGHVAFINTHARTALCVVRP
jgi:competence protein ComEC